MLRATPALLLASLAAGGEGWDRFRGPNGTGLAGDGEAYPVAIAPGEHELWSREFPEGMSSPVVSATHLFLTGLEEERLFTYAVDRATGATVWKREAPRSRRTEFHGKNHAAAASAAVDGEHVVASFDEFGLVCYDHAGEERWRRPLGPFDNVYGMGASPILVDGVCVLACDQQTGSFVLALDAASGEERWRVPRPQAISGHCTPVVVRPEGGAPQIVLPGSFLLDAYDLASGERAWWVEGLPSEMKSVPVILGDTLYVHGYASPLNDRGNQVELGSFADTLTAGDADGDGALAAAELPDQRVARYFQWLDTSGDGSLDAEEWDLTRALFAAVNSAMAVRLGGSGNLTGQVLWRQYRGIPQLPSPLVVADTYYMLSDQGGLLTTLDPATGERRGRARLEGAEDAYFASPVAGGGHVYLMSEGGILTVLVAGGALEPVHTADFGAPSYSTPALVDGVVYVRTMRRLFAFGDA